MRFTLWIASLWPGCWHTWQLGHWRGLALAAAFGASLSAALVTTFVWPEWIGTGTPPAANIGLSWFVVLGLWAIGAVWLWRDVKRLAPHSDGESRDDLERLFEQAQHEYLKGHWIETETLIGKLLGTRFDDVEARLLLASVQRRTKRWSEARTTLNTLKEHDAAARWLLEIETELERIVELESDTNAESGVQDDNDNEMLRAA